MKIVDVAGKATPLRTYLQTCSQQALAERVGLTQGAISQMLANGRTVWVIESSRGRVVTLYEWKWVAGGRA